MKEVKKVLSAALATTLVTGLAGTVVGATTVDDLYKAAYEATMNALNKKDQDSINAAREAINQLPAELQGFKGEFSKQVDTVQHPILVKIVDSINNADKSLKQVDINTARKAIPANLPAEWRNSYSTGLDAVQQKLIVKVDEAAKKAEKSQAKADVDAAMALIKEVATVENNDGVKTWATTYEKEFISKVKLSVADVEVLNNNTIKVNFIKEVDAKTVTTKSFAASETESKKQLWVSSVKVSDDKKSVEVKFADTFVDGKENTLEVKNIKDLAGVAMVTSTTEFEYAKAELSSVELTKTTVGLNVDLKEFVVVKDELDRDVTKGTTITFETSNASVVGTDGKTTTKEGQAIVKVIAKKDKEVVKSEDIVVKVVKASNVDYQGFVLYENGKAPAAVYSKVENKVTDLKNGSAVNKVALFFKDQYGVEQTPVTDFTVVKNLTPEVAILKADGSIEVVSTGTADFRVKVGEVERVISVEIKDASKATELSLDKTSVSLAAKKTGETAVAQNVKVAVKDQYEASVNDTTTVLKVEVKDKDGKFQDITSVEGKAVETFATVQAGEIKLNENGEATLTLTPGEKAGSNSYKVTYTVGTGDNAITLSKEFAVEVKAQGDLAGYEVDTVDTLDLLDNAETKTIVETEGVFNVYRLDTNKNRVELVGAPVVKVMNEKGDDVTNTFDLAQAGKIVVKANTTKVGTYKVEVRVNTYLAKTYTLTVKDSTKKPTTVVFNELSATTTSTSAAVTVDLTKITTIVDQFGNKVVLGDADTVASVATSKATNEVKNSNNELVAYDLVVTSVNVKVGATTTEVKLASPVVVRVSVVK